MLKVLKLIHGKGTIQDPEAYKVKIKHMMKVDRAKRDLLRKNSNSSFKSLFSKSQSSGFGKSEVSGSASENDNENID